MRIPKTAVVFSTLALSAAVVLNAAPDNDAQTKAREALRKKMTELDALPPGTVPPSNVSAAPGLPPASAGNTEPLRDATRRKIAELNENGGVATVPSLPAEKIEDMRSRMRNQIVEENAKEQAATAAAKPAPAKAPTTAADAKAQAETEKQAAPEAKARAEEEKRALAAAKAKPSAAAVAGSSAFPPLTAPPAGLSGNKESRLAELTRRYKADEVTPEDYHKERAKILAEP